VDFRHSARSERLQESVRTFMETFVVPAEAEHYAELRTLPSRYHETAAMAALKGRARKAGLWNLFMPDPKWGPGLSNAEYAPIAEIMGYSLIGPEAFNCAAPDTGNMELLARFGTPEQQQRWLIPLLAGEIRSCFSMTEPEVASSDATNIAATIVRDGEDYVINGRKWWTTNGARPQAAVSLFLGVSEPEADPHERHSIVLVPLDHPRVHIERTLSVLGYDEGDSHAEMTFDDVRVPAANLLQNEGDGFRIAQARLGPGRIHHCMRALGQAERALELLCRRAGERTAFGQPLADHQIIRRWIAQSRTQIDQARLLTMHTAWLIDELGSREARAAISMIKLVAPTVALDVLDRAMQTFGAAGLSQDTPLARHYAHARTLRIVDGPDEVHLMSVARHELSRQTP
jgi:acyl-CoA dehydrogenase